MAARSGRFVVMEATSSLTQVSHHTAVHTHSQLNARALENFGGAGFLAEVQLAPQLS